MSFPLDRLAVSSILQDLSTSRLGRRIVLYEEIESTNTEGMRLAREGAEEGTLVLAETQTKGRGRLGRVWQSPKGQNLYLSLILRPSCAAREIPWLGLATAIALAQTIKEQYGLHARVKWPNDIEISKRKVAGILTEATIHLGQVEFLVLGIGVNLNMGCEDFLPELRLTATSLKIEHGQNIIRTRFLQQLLVTLEAWYGKFHQSLYDDIRKVYLTYLEILGLSVRIQQADNVIQGTVTGISPEGALMLRRTNGQETTIHSGDVMQVRVENDFND